MLGLPPIIIKYDSNRYNFRPIIEKILNMDALESLHDMCGKDGVFSREKDQSTIWHRKYYENFSLIKPLYNDFINSFIKKLYNNQPIIFQTIPTFRVHLVGNLAVGEWHKDSKYNHSEEEINFWLPFTDAFDTNTVWTESEVDKGDYAPQKVNYGELLIFNGAKLFHGNKVNTTAATRVSFDFRVVEKSKFVPSSKQSVNTGSKFDIGGYFSESN